MPYLIELTQQQIEAITLSLHTRVDMHPNLPVEEKLFLLSVCHDITVQMIKHDNSGEKMIPITFDAL